MPLNKDAIEEIQQEFFQVLSEKRLEDIVKKMVAPSEEENGESEMKDEFGMTLLSIILELKGHAGLFANKVSHFFPCSFFLFCF